MELQRFIWSWDTAASRLRATDPVAAFALQSACRPIATDRRRDGTLLLVIGCWYAYFRDLLSGEQSKARLTEKFSQFFGDKLELRFVDWPGGVVAADEPRYARSRARIERVLAGGDPELELPEVTSEPPPVVRSESDDALGEAAKLESAIHRLFFDRLLRHDVVPRCQYQVQHFRLNFALPDERVGADIVGWDARFGPRQGQRGPGREREQEIAGEGWHVLVFSGSEVHRDVEACVGQFLAAVRGRGEQRQRPRGPIRDPRLDRRRW